MVVFLPIIFFALGAVAGSFINAAVYRVKTKKDFVFARSMCPKCKHKLSALDLIPLFSYLFLLAKCRYCKKPISAEYPIVEFSVGLLFLINYYFYFRFPDISSIEKGSVALILFPLIAFIFVYDLKYRLILTGPIILLYILGVFYFALTHTGIAPHLIVTAALFGAFYFLYTYSKGAWMGGGDVKMVPAFGIFFGILGLQAAALGFISGALYSIPLLISKKKSLKSTIPFGPFLIIGFFLTYLFGDKIWVSSTLFLAGLFGYN